MPHSRRLGLESQELLLGSGLGPSGRSSGAWWSRGGAPEGDTAMRMKLYKKIFFPRSDLFLLVQAWSARHVALLVEGHGGGDSEQDVEQRLGGGARVYLRT